MYGMLAFVLLVSMAAISADYSVQALLINQTRINIFSMDNDFVTFFLSAITSVVAIVSAILFMRKDSKTTNRLTFCVTLALAALWTGALIYFVLRKYNTGNALQRQVDIFRLYSMVSGLLNDKNRENSL